MKLICPVSGTENEDREFCRQCGTDLRPLIAVEQLPAAALREGETLLGSGQALAAIEQLAVAAVLSPASAPARQALAEARAKTGEEATQLATRNRRLRLLLGVVPAAALFVGIVAAIAVQAALHPRPVPPDWAHVVQDRLAANPVTASLHLKVSASGDAVRIAGEAPTELHRALALAVAGQDVAVKIDASQVTVAPPPAPATYTIRAGDSWWVIARRVYGSSRFWPQLAKANPAQNQQGIALRPGQSVALPTVTITPH
ncbi:MAG: hypothetical protein WCE75_01090 [Terracidiphilus sp.]